MMPPVSLFDLAFGPQVPALPEGITPLGELLRRRKALRLSLARWLHPDEWLDEREQRDAEVAELRAQLDAVKQEIRATLNALEELL